MLTDTQRNIIALIRSALTGEKAEISLAQKKRLESIQRLLDRADALTKI